MRWGESEWGEWGERKKEGRVRWESEVRCGSDAREKECVCVWERGSEMRESEVEERRRVRWECGKIGRWEWGMWFEGKGKRVGWERELEWGDSKVWGEREVEVSEEGVSEVRVGRKM